MEEGWMTGWEASERKINMWMRRWEVVQGDKCLKEVVELIDEENGFLRY